MSSYSQTMLYGRLSLYSHFVINVLYISFLPEYFTQTDQFYNNSPHATSIVIT